MPVEKINEPIAMLESQAPSTMAISCTCERWCSVLTV